MTATLNLDEKGQGKAKIKPKNMTLICIDANIWNAVTSIATCLLVIVALFVVCIQKNQLKLINSAKTINEYHDRYEFKDFKDKRKVLADIIIKKNDLGKEDVLILFETMGYLTQHKVLIEEMVWNEFSWDVIRYYNALRNYNGTDYIDKLRKVNNDITLYSNFEWLYNSMIKIDIKKRKAESTKKRKAESIRKRKVELNIVIPNQNDLNNFLNKELE